jgi:hypothetical protein
VLSFVRGEGEARVFAVFNLSPRGNEVTFELARHHGAFSDAMTGESLQLSAETALTLDPWGYRIFTAE